MNAEGHNRISRGHIKGIVEAHIDSQIGYPVSVRWIEYTKDLERPVSERYVTIADEVFEWPHDGGIVRRLYALPTMN